VLEEKTAIKMWVIATMKLRGNDAKRGLPIQNCLYTLHCTLACTHCICTCQGTMPMAKKNDAASQRCAGQLWLAMPHHRVKVPAQRFSQALPPLRFMQEFPNIPLLWQRHYLALALLLPQAGGPGLHHPLGSTLVSSCVGACSSAWAFSAAAFSSFSLANK